MESGDYLFVENSTLENIYLIDSGGITLAKLNEGVKIELMNQVEGDIVGVDILFK